MIDLHTHTTASDGTLSPRELVNLAINNHLKAIAITDHDTTDGVGLALKAAKKKNLTIISGIEISVNFNVPKTDAKGPGWMHILVYNLKPGGPLSKEISKLKKWRNERNKKILIKLNKLGFPISYKDVLKEAGGNVVGRPHFARALKNKGYVSSLNEAFNLYLKKGKPAYVNRKRLSLTNTLKKSRREGAIPVLAHPFTLNIKENKMFENVKRWKKLGLRGIEIIYPEHNLKYRRKLSKIAKSLDLIITGGSDFHGKNKPNIKLGSGINKNVNVPDKILKRIQDT